MNAVMICLSKFVVITDLHVEYPDRCGSFDSGSEREGRGRGGGGTTTFERFYLHIQK